jgi:hypothetical protein
MWIWIEPGDFGKGKLINKLLSSILRNIIPAPFFLAGFRDLAGLMRTTKRH